MSDQVPRAYALKKRLWEQIVRAKILAQGAALAAVGAPSGGFSFSRARSARATPITSRPRRRGAIGRCCSGWDSIATPMATG